jgi:K+-transporting ATPase KdpF subunit
LLEQSSRFSWWARCTRCFAKSCRVQMETVIVGIIALLLFVYLLVAMIRPEKF